MFRANRQLIRFLIDDRAAVTIDYVVVTAMIVVLTVGLAQPLYDAVTLLMADIGQVFAAAPTVDADDWPSAD